MNTFPFRKVRLASNRECAGNCAVVREVSVFSLSGAEIVVLTVRSVRSFTFWKMEFKKIEKLTGEENWANWKFQVRLILMSNDLMGIVDGSVPLPLTDQTKWKSNDCKAQAIIGTAVAGNQLVHIRNCKTSKEMWDRLLSVFEERNEMSCLALHQKFMTMKKEETENMVTFISRIEEVVNRIRELKGVLSEDFVISKIIMSLPEEYNSFSTSWESAAKTERTLDKLRSRLTSVDKKDILRLNVLKTEEMTEEMVVVQIKMFLVPSCVEMTKHKVAGFSIQEPPVI